MQYVLKRPRSDVQIIINQIIVWVAAKITKITASAKL